MNNFEDYLNEYQAIGVGPMIYDLISGVVTEVVQYYPPSIYSSNGRWDEDAISGFCNDFIFDKLLCKGWLDSHFLSLDSIQGLKKTLKRDCRHYLINRKTRTEKSNLYMRVKKTLKDSPEKFQPLANSNTNGDLWGLTGWIDKEIAQDINFVLMKVAIIAVPRTNRYGIDSLKISPLINNSELTSLIEQIFINVDKQVSLSILFESICKRLGVITDETISLDDPLSSENDQVLEDIVSGPDNHIEIEISSKQIAENILQKLSDRQREILWLQFSVEAPNLTEIGQRLEISKSTVSNEISNIEKIILNSETELSNFDLILGYLKELLDKKSK